MVRLHSLCYTDRLTIVVDRNIKNIYKLPITTMNNLSNRVPDFFGSESEGSDRLWQYVQSLNPETIAQLSKASASAVQVIERNIVGMLGTLPPEHFGVTITTSREHLGRLLASAMISGYFLHSAEQRMAFEQSLQVSTDANSTDS